jgi:two-component system response regulator BaeR
MSETALAQTILIVEDDAKIADMLANYLHMHGYKTAVCGNGNDAVAMVQAIEPVLMLLDLMLPGQDGIAVCSAVFSALPIIMVTARVDEIDRLIGLETGADDYVCKPFSPREVVARVKALLRRTHGPLAQAASVNSGFQLDETTLQITWQGVALPLTQVEFRLLRTLLARPGQVLGRARLLDCLHEDMRDVSDRAIDSHIKNLRRKLDQAHTGENTIVSVYGVGYRLDT